MRSFVIMFLVLFFAACSSLDEKDCVKEECSKKNNTERYIDFEPRRFR